MLSLSCPWKLPWIHSLHDNLVLLALHHIICKHGMEVRDGGRQDDPVGTELVVPYLEGIEEREGGQSAQLLAWIRGD